jgi:hypothetical protein
MLSESVSPRLVKKRRLKTFLKSVSWPGQLLANPTLRVVSFGGCPPAFSFGATSPERL